MIITTTITAAQPPTTVLSSVVLGGTEFSTVVALSTVLSKPGRDGILIGGLDLPTYDPQVIAGDVFSMGNMVESTTEKIFTSFERTKLAGIETAATADQTGAEIKLLYEAENDTNVFTNAEKAVVANTSGTNTGDQDLSGKENVGVAQGITDAHEGAFVHTDITHTNRAALDLVSGENTGDQTLPTAGDFNHDDLTGIAGTPAEYNHPTNAQMTVLGNTSGANSGDEVVAVGSELDAGVDDTKYASAKAIKDAHNVPSVAPGTSGNVLTSDGTDWVSAAGGLSDPMTTQGDIIVRASGGTDRLALGASEQILVSNGTDITWSANTGGFNYTSAANPAAGTNPTASNATWLNSTNGNTFICTDNTTDANVWKLTSGHRGALVYIETTAFSMANVQITAIEYDSEVYDTDGFWEGVTNPDRITIPFGVSKVRLAACVLWTDSSGRKVSKITKNGSDFIGTPRVTADGDIAAGQQIVTPVLEVSEGDYFRTEGFQASGGALDVPAGKLNWFSIEVIA